MDIAAERGREEIISLLAEFTEMPDHVKLLHLSMLMYKGEHKAKEREQFKNILSSLSVELVSRHIYAMLKKTFFLRTPSHR